MMVEQTEDKAAEILYIMMEKLAEDGEYILSAMDKLVYLEKSGILDEVLKLSEIALAMSKMPEEMLDKDVQEVATKNLELLLTLALSVDDSMIKRLNSFIEAFKETEEFDSVGIKGMLMSMRDPDVQKALGYLLTLAKNLGKKL
jgi:uncharacterized protein YjgD (DUF1641 family)